MASVNTVETINSIEEGRLALDMDRKALAYVLSFVNPKLRAVAARQAERHMFEQGLKAKRPATE